MKSMRIILMLVLLTLAALLQAGEKEKSALFIALESSDTSGLKAALDNGANVEEEYHFGWKPVMKAAYMKNTEAVKILLNAGASPNASDQLGESALHVAVGAPLSISKALLSAGTKVNAKNAASITPLMLAAGAGAGAGDISLVKLLLSHGADISFVDYQGKLAIEWAKRKMHYEIMKILDPTSAPNKSLNLTVNIPRFSRDESLPKMERANNEETPTTQKDPKLHRGV